LEDIIDIELVKPVFAIYECPFCPSETLLSLQIVLFGLTQIIACSPNPFVRIEKRSWELFQGVVDKFSYAIHELDFGITGINPFLPCFATSCLTLSRSINNSFLVEDSRVCVFESSSKHRRMKKVNGSYCIVGRSAFPA
jgi:hypothetical protein